MITWQRIKQLVCRCRFADCTSDDGYIFICSRCGKRHRVARKVCGSIARRIAYQNAARDAGFYAGGYVADGNGNLRALGKVA